MHKTYSSFSAFPWSLQCLKEDASSGEDAAIYLQKKKKEKRMAGPQTYCALQDF